MPIISVPCPHCGRGFSTNTDVVREFPEYYSHVESCSKNPKNIRSTSSSWKTAIATAQLMFQVASSSTASESAAANYVKAVLSYQQRQQLEQRLNGLKLCLSFFILITS